MDNQYKSIGEELIQQSEGPKRKKRGKSDGLFPYIKVANMNGMSCRAITDWLKEKHDISLSLAMIAKVIRESDKRCLRLFEEMHHKETLLYASIPLSTQNTTSPSSSSLFNKAEFESRTAIRADMKSHLLAKECGTRNQAEELYNELIETWFSLPELFRTECQRVVSNQENNNEHDDRS